MARARLFLRSLPAEIRNPVEREVVRVVEIVRAALVIVEGRTAGGDDVGTVEQPIHVLNPPNETQP